MQFQDFHRRYFVSSLVVQKKKKGSLLSPSFVSILPLSNNSLIFHYVQVSDHL